MFRYAAPTKSALSKELDVAFSVTFFNKKIACLFSRFSNISFNFFNFETSSFAAFQTLRGQQCFGVKWCLRKCKGSFSV